eukprot:SAG31_NODE_8458_length_1447_cov_1.069733_2_plen_203_part_00
MNATCSQMLKLTNGCSGDSSADAPAFFVPCFFGCRSQRPTATTNEPFVRISSCSRWCFGVHACWAQEQGWGWKGGDLHTKAVQKKTVMAPLESSPFFLPHWIGDHLHVSTAPRSKMILCLLNWHAKSVFARWWQPETSSDLDAAHPDLLLGLRSSRVPNRIMGGIYGFIGFPTLNSSRDHFELEDGSAFGLKTSSIFHPRIL